MNRRHFLRAACIVAAIGAAATGRAHAHDEDVDEILRARRAGKILPLEDIAARAARDLDARVLDAHLESGRLDRAYVYELRLLAADGRVLKAWYDAATGEQLQVRGHQRH